jgi:hypothetical protein
MRNEWEFWNRWARQLEKENNLEHRMREFTARSLRRSIGFGNRVAVALDWRWAYVAFQRGARPIADVRESLGPARPVTDSLKSQFSTRDHPCEHVIFPNKLMKQRCPDMSHPTPPLPCVGERSKPPGHEVVAAGTCTHPITLGQTASRTRAVDEQRLPTGLPTDRSVLMRCVTGANFRAPCLAFRTVRGG